MVHAPAPTARTPVRARSSATAALVLADGTTYFGQGAGAPGIALGELCFNTAMTGYQEILTDPSYTDQLIAFTFPHIGNVGTNGTDVESAVTQAPGQARAPSDPPVTARGAVFRAPITAASNWRAESDLNAWLVTHGVTAITGVDTRAITRRIRDQGMPHAVVAFDPAGAFDLEDLTRRARAWPGIEGAELARRVTTAGPYETRRAAWSWPMGAQDAAEPLKRVAVLDFGVKSAILARVASLGAEAVVLPADTRAEDVLALKPDGIVLANGPGDPAATAEYAAAHIRTLLDSGVPIMGICLGHQLLALAAGAKTVKMDFGHHGANHPVLALQTGQVAIVSMNHGFAVDRESLPEHVRETHVSLFDGSNCGIALKDRPAFSVQHHPEASPGPHDAFAVFDAFAAAMEDYARTAN